MIRHPPEAWIVLAAGLAWLVLVGGSGLLGLATAILPGCFLVGSSVAMLLWSVSDRRMPQFASLGAVLGLLLAAPAAFLSGIPTGVALALLSGGALVASGLASLRLDPAGDLASASRSPVLAARVGIDDAVVASSVLTTPLPHGDDHRRILLEVERALDLYRERGWIHKPESFHRAPPPPDDASIRPSRSLGRRFEHLTWDSGYEPWEDEPGRDRWLAHAPNRTAHAWVVRGPDPSRPWLLCVHGYRMGFPWTDLPVFEAERLRRDLDLNVVCPALPLHGPRRIGMRSGSGFLGGDFLDLIHAEAQTIWDLRRVVAWVRAQGGERIGVYGLSLGGYNTALLAGLEDALECAVVGIPATDFAHLTWHHGPPHLLEEAARAGVTPEQVGRILSVVSPLSVAPRVPARGRFIFAGAADRLAPPDQARRLWEHWGRPEIVWYAGTHLSFRREPAVRALVRRALEDLAGASPAA